MLKYRHSNVIGCNVLSKQHQLNFLDDTLRVTRKNLSLTMGYCKFMQRKYYDNDLNPHPEYLSYEEYVEETEIMIDLIKCIFDWMSFYSGSKRDMIESLMYLEITIDDEVIVKTMSESLRKELKDVVQKKGKKFRTVRV